MPFDVRGPLSVPASKAMSSSHWSTRAPIDARRARGVGATQHGPGKGKRTSVGLVEFSPCTSMSTHAPDVRSTPPKYPVRSVSQRETLTDLVEARIMSASRIGDCHVSGST